MDSESSQLAYQLQTEEITLVDVAHLCKSLRNYITNHYMLLDGYLVNTRTLLAMHARGDIDTSPQAFVPQDKQRTNYWNN